MMEKFGWKLRDIIVLCVLGVAFGALYLGGISIWAVANAVFGPIGLDMVYGIWFTASITAAYIIRKPGIAFGAEMMAALGEVILGTPSGIMVFVGAAIQGLGCEAVFAATGWKKYSTPVLIFAGMGASVTSFIYNYFAYGYSSFSMRMLVSMLAVRLVSGALLAGLLGKLIGDGLATTGALSSFPLGNERSQKKVSA
ncbi:ECF transporter S component [Alkalibacter mobilis]|uniref:ECF transporter S component n=1 Tax=Alkalibacter mobilis TaxID=2787712 RepID=UPI00189DE089|nr:ECF transporter S component [Alkalibacter mobilis]MBF7097766.1 ECF transporter S component [Alkalibacter mobilis]